MAGLLKLRRLIGPSAYPNEIPSIGPIRAASPKLPSGLTNAVMMHIWRCVFPSD